MEEAKKGFISACKDLNYDYMTGQYDPDSYDRYDKYKQQLLDLGLTEDEIDDLEYEA